MYNVGNFSKRTPKSNINLIKFQSYLKIRATTGCKLQKTIFHFQNRSTLSQLKIMRHSCFCCYKTVSENVIIQILKNEARKPPDLHGNVYRINHLEICNVSLFIIIIIRVIPDSFLNTLLLILCLEQSEYAGIHLVCTCHLFLLTLWRKNIQSGVHTTYDRTRLIYME